MQTSTNEN